jgi:cytochrome P450
VPLVPVTFTDGRGESVVAEPGRLVLTVLGAGNHDPAMFDAPHELRLDRPNAAKHLSFGGGIHYCLGASLAKLEAGIAITKLIRRFDTIELAGQPHWRGRVTIRGVDHLPLTLS